MTNNPPPTDTSTGSSRGDAIAEAQSVMQAHLDAINARDQKAIAATLHFPHYRLVDGQLKLWESGETYLSDFYKRAGRNWGYSSWSRLDVVHASADKVHLDVQVNRYTEDGRLLASFESIWVIARLNGRWAAQLRSTFAPDEKIIETWV